MDKKSPAFSGALMPGNDWLSKRDGGHPERYRDNSYKQCCRIILDGLFRSFRHGAPPTGYHLE